MAKATPATRALDRAGIDYKLHEYNYDPNADRIGMQAAEALGVAPGRLLKTLMAKTVSAKSNASNHIVCVLAPSDREVNLKKLAIAAGGKSATMLPSAEAERASGYHVGGISPFGQRRAVPVYLDADATAFATVIVNGGRRGLQIEIASDDLIRLLGARIADLSV